MKEPHVHAEGIPPHPNLDKMGEVEHEAAIIAEFLDWLFSPEPVGAGYTPARWGENGFRPDAAQFNHEEVLRRYFEIDSDAAERERTALLEYQRQLNREHYPEAAPKPSGQSEEAPDVRLDHHRLPEDRGA